MQAPLAHDYDGIQWRPLDAQIRQAIIVAPGYTAVVENDPRVDPETLIRRIERLPDDVRSARLEEIRLGVRPHESGEFDISLEIRIYERDASSQPLRFSLDDIAFEDDWAIVEIEEHIWAGTTILVVVGPSAGWEYGLTADRVPYGGYPALATTPESEPQRLQGSLAFQTIFSQSTDRSRLLEESVFPSIGATLRDPLLIVVYAIILGLAGSTVWIRRYHRRAG